MTPLRVILSVAIALIGLALGLTAMALGSVATDLARLADWIVGRARLLLPMGANDNKGSQL